MPTVLMTFFTEEVQTIRDALPTEEGGGAKFCSPAKPDSVAACLETFESVNSVIVRKLISRMKMTQCLLDSCPASLLRDSLPVITDIFSLTLSMFLLSRELFRSPSKKQTFGLYSKNHLLIPNC